MNTEVIYPNAATRAEPTTENQASTANAEKAFVQATDQLISLYRSVERRSLDLPVLSFMPFIVFIWEVLKFYFFLSIGIWLIIPVNLVVLIRNFFPGRWRYRPFFLRQVHYLWLWIWRGEAPTAPFIFIRPLFSIFMKGHFESRLRRLRNEISLQDSVSDATRVALLERLDVALEQWKSPRFNAIFWTVLLPGVIWLPTWGKQITDCLSYFEIHLPVGAIEPHISREGLLLIAMSVVGYLLIIPLTAFLSKRGLFIGRNSNRIWFPGGQEGGEVYSKEREILATVGLHLREAPVDLWIMGFSLLVSAFFAWRVIPTVAQTIIDFEISMPAHLFDISIPPEVRDQMLLSANSESHTLLVEYCVLILVLFVAAFRRRKTARL